MVREICEGSHVPVTGVRLQGDDWCTISVGIRTPPKCTTRHSKTTLLQVQVQVQMGHDGSYRVSIISVGDDRTSEG